MEIDGKRPHGNPLDMPRSRCQQLRKMAADKGIEIYAVAGNNDFSSPIPEHRECQFVYARELMRMTADLGAKIVRVFLAWPGVTMVPEGGALRLRPEAVRPGARGLLRGADLGMVPRGAEKNSPGSRATSADVTLALQNHVPVIKGYDDVLRMVKEVGSPHLKVCFDAPLMDDRRSRDPKGGERGRRPADVLALRRRIRPRAGRQDRQQGRRQVSLGMLGMLDIGYRGYAGFELCHPLPVVNGKTVGIDFVDKNAQLAAEYMRGVSPRRKRPRGSRPRNRRFLWTEDIS